MALTALIYSTACCGTNGVNVQCGTNSVHLSVAGVALIALMYSVAGVALMVLMYSVAGVALRVNIQCSRCDTKSVNVQ